MLGVVECTNLFFNAKENAVTDAETTTIAQTATFCGREFLNLVEQWCDKRQHERQAVFVEVDARHPKRKKVTVRDFAYMYAHRPSHQCVWFLSPSEYTSYWEPRLFTYPLSLRAVGAAPNVDTALGNARRREGRTEQIDDCAQ